MVNHSLNVSREFKPLTKTTFIESGEKRGHMRAHSVEESPVALPGLRSASSTQEYQTSPLKQQNYVYGAEKEVLVNLLPLPRIHERVRQRLRMP